MSRRNFELDSNSGRPALVWYLQNTVKRPPEESWECLLDHSCGGFSCNTLDGWVQRINLAEPTMSLISRIADEEFAAGCKGESLDYGVGVDHRAAYEAFLQAHGLVSGNPRMLQQAEIGRAHV